MITTTTTTTTRFGGWTGPSHFHILTPHLHRGDAQDAVNGFLTRDTIVRDETKATRTGGIGIDHHDGVHDTTKTFKYLAELVPIHIGCQPTDEYPKIMEAVLGRRRWRTTIGRIHVVTTPRTTVGC